MTNTQSPAPVVAATVEQLTEMMKQYRYQGVNSLDASLAEFQAALRTALQASAVAVPVGYASPARLRDLKDGRALSASVVNKDEAVLEAGKGFELDIPLYTAPPLQAQVQEAEVMVDMGPPATSRDRWMYEQGRLAERDPRTPVPGMAKHVLATLDALGDDAAVHIFPDDLEKCSRSECVVEVFSVRAASPDNGNTVPLFSREQIAAALRADPL